MDFQPSDSNNAVQVGCQNQPSSDTRNVQAHASPEIANPAVPPPQHRGSAENVFQNCVIAGIQIKFPFSPYSIQENLMKQILDTVKSNDTLIIDAGPGTGKTLAVLCSLLAWQKHQHSAPASSSPTPSATSETSSSPSCSPSKKFKSSCCTTPRNQIIYAVKTIAEANEIVAQLRKTPYRPRLAVLASKSVLCLPQHPDSRPVYQPRAPDTPSKSAATSSNGNGKNPEDTVTPEDEDPEDQEDVADYSSSSAGIGPHVKCNCVRESFPPSDPPAPSFWSTDNMCSFGKSFRASRDNFPFKIRQLVEEGTAKKFCPYYCAIHMSKNAELILCTYNYLLDQGIRESCDIELSNCVVVLDEAHNLGEKCREALTKKLDKKHLEKLLEQLEKIENPAQVLSQSAQSQVNRRLPVVISAFENLISALMDNSIPIRTQQFSDPLTDSYRAFSNILNTLDFGKDQIDSYLTCLSTLAMSTSNISKLTRQAIEELREMLEVFKFLQSFPPEEQNGFEIVVNEIKAKTTDEHNVELKIMFLKTSLLFKSIKTQPISLILLSGSFPPPPYMEKYLVSELFENHNDFKLWQPPIGSDRSIDPTRFFVSFLNKRLNCDDAVLKFDSKNGTRSENLDPLAHIVSAILGLVPHGAAIVFRTKDALVKTVTHWYRTGVLELLALKKQLFTEVPLWDQGLINEAYLADFIGTKNTPLEEIFNEFKAASVTPKGAVLFTYCRGSLTEGVNYAGDECRVVIAVGVPYPNLSAIGMQEKRAFNDRMRINDDKYISGSRWYASSAMQALNSAFGRSIRGPNDWGLVFAIDDQFFAREEDCKLISPWVTHSWKQRSSVWEDIVPHVREFIQLHENKQHNEA